MEQLQQLRGTLTPRPKWPWPPPPPPPPAAELEREIGGGVEGEAGGGGGAAAGPSFHLRSPSTGSNKSGKGKTGSQKIDGPQKLPPLSAV